MAEFIGNPNIVRVHCYFEENGSGKIRRIINEASEQTEIFLAHMLPDFTGAIVTPIAMVVLLFIFDWRLGLISLLPIIIGIYFRL